MQIRMSQLSKEKYFISNKFHLILNLSFWTQNEGKLFQNMSSAIVIISALRVKFKK